MLRLATLVSLVYAAARVVQLTSHNTNNTHNNDNGDHCSVGYLNGTRAAARCAGSIVNGTGTSSVTTCWPHVRVQCGEREGGSWGCHGVQGFLQDLACSCSGFEINDVEEIQ